MTRSRFRFIKELAKQFISSLEGKSNTNAPLPSAIGVLVAMLQSQWPDLASIGSKRMGLFLQRDQSTCINKTIKINNINSAKIGAPLNANETTESQSGSLQRPFEVKFPKTKRRHSTLYELRKYLWNPKLSEWLMTGNMVFKPLYFHSSSQKLIYIIWTVSRLSYVIRHTAHVKRSLVS